MTRWLLLFFALLASIQSFVVGAEAVDTQKLDDEIRRIFNRSCTECHAEGISTKVREFGYILQLPKLAYNGEFVDLDDPEFSILIECLVDGTMPPPKSHATSPPLSDEEIETVRQWVFSLQDKRPINPEKKDSVGTNSNDNNDPASTSQESGHYIPAEEPPFSLAAFIGHFHPIFLHFPIALLICAFLRQILAWWKPSTAAGDSIRYMLWLGALSAIASAVSGWLAGEYLWDTPDGKAVSDHRWQGITATALAICLVVIYEVKRCKEWRWVTPVYVLLLVATVFFIFLAAHHGGKMSHPDFPL